MPVFSPGQIVVRRWSKAQTLKKKVFKIIEVDPTTLNTYNTKYRVLDAYGKQLEFYNWDLRDINEEYTNLRTEASNLEQQAVRKRNQACKFKQEMDKAHQFFPVV